MITLLRALPAPCVLILILLPLLLMVSGCAKTISSNSYPQRTKESRPPQPSNQELKGTYKPYSVFGQTYRPLLSSDNFVEEGVASWYGTKFHGRPTACGERYDMHAMTAAHRVLPMQTRVRVTNLENGRVVDLRINDRGPFAKNRIIDLSYAAAQKLGIVDKGTARVRVQSLSHVPEDIPGRFYIQTGSFLEQDNALRLRRELLSSYPGSRVVEVKINGKRFWRVQAGLFQGYKSAERALPRLLNVNGSAFILAD
ncbi:MAG: septal ring lytic transglycosylase RlpA family protein [Desulfovibrionales bacterium]